MRFFQYEVIISYESTQMSSLEEDRKYKEFVTSFSVLAGKLQRPAKGMPISIRFIKLSSSDRTIYRYWTHILAYGAIGLALAFAALIFRPENWVINLFPNTPFRMESIIMLLSLVLLQLFVITSTFAATRSTLSARNPVPLEPPKGLRVAFATTRAPGEPYAIVETTLTAAKQVKYTYGTVDVWLLDETNDPELRELCTRLKVGYFSRSGILAWNTSMALDKHANAHFAAKTKHGNFNAWLEYLDVADITYDILAGVDTDQVPQLNFLTRILGYFHDENIAYAVGPQVYGNYRSGLSGLVTRWAESQASFFQSTIQRAGNASGSAMFVGTNYAVRMSALKQVGGFQPFITEDMATGLAIHASKNSNTGKHWRSVYTPDVLAIGEGPSFWGPYFSQQWRWSAGAFDTLRRLVWRVLFKLPPRALMHYVLVLSFYPMAAITWIIAFMSCVMYLISGATAVIAPWGEFFSLYTMTIIMQLSLYFWNRRYNVSPHEAAGSLGITGMIITSIAAPIYVSALVGIIFGRRATFVVTRKGESHNPDWILTFRTQLLWILALGVATAYAIGRGNANPAMLLWVAIITSVCLLPLLLGLSVAQSGRLPKIPLPAFNDRTEPALMKETSHA